MAKKVRNVKKSLAGMEDIVQGKGEVSQTRGGGAVILHKMDVPFALDTTVEMSALDVAKYTRARVYSDTVSYTDYIYDADDLTGIESDTGPGTWILADNEGLAGAIAVDIINDISQEYDIGTAQLVADSAIVFPVDKMLRTKGRYTVDDNLGCNYLVKAASETAFDILLSDGKYAVFKGYVGLSLNAMTMYVNSTLGTDSILNGSGTGVDAFKTLQYAQDSLPCVIDNKIIQLEDGTHNDNYRDAGSMIRAAILFNKGKFVAARTQKNGNDLVGGLVIKGNSVTPANVVVAPNDTYPYGIYNAQGQIGLQDFHIVTEAGSTSVNNLLTSHRMDSYVHAVNVTLDGRDKTVTSRGLLTESGGQIEYTTTLTQTDIKNCSILASTLTSGDVLTMSGQLTLDTADTGIQALNNSSVKLVGSGLVGQEIKNCSANAIAALSGAVVEVRGSNGANHILIDGTVDVGFGGMLDMIWADTTGLVTVELGKIRYNNSNYQRQVSCKAGEIWLINSNSYISPAVANTDVIPLALQQGSREYREGTNNVVGSGGLSASRNPLVLTYNGDGQTKAITDGVDVYTVNGSGANRVNCEIATAGITEGRTIHVFGNTWGASFTSGVTMDIEGSLPLGSGTGSYTGATLTLVGGLWRVAGIGQVRT